MTRNRRAVVSAFPVLLCLAGTVSALAVLSLPVRQADAQDSPFGARVEDVLAGTVPVWDRPTLTTYGTAGLLEMPAAVAMRDGDVSLTNSYYQGTNRVTLTFQITPRLSGSFRYAWIEDFDRSGDMDRYDRSVDLRYTLLEETSNRPAVAVGLRDFGGTGIYAGEYLVATKTYDRLRVTGGLGWGRLGSYKGFSNPLGVLNSRFEDRPAGERGIGNTGKPDFGQWFRGDAALFGGVQYQVNDRTVLTAEYSSDAYRREVSRTSFDHASPVNLGATYRFRNGIDMTAAWLHGSQAALLFSYTANPQTPRYPGGLEASGPPVLPRDQAPALGWGALVGDPALKRGLTEQTRVALQREGLELEALELVAPGYVRVYLRNSRYDAVPQAIGRAGRVLSHTLPASVERMVIVPVQNGMPLSAVTLRRSDLEELEFDYDGAWKAYSRAEIEDAAAYPLPRDALVQGAFPRHRLSLDSYVDPSYFDPDNPLRLDLGVELNAAYVPRPGLIFSGRMRYPLVGNRDEVTRTSNSVLPHVRSDAGLYAIESDLELNHLTAEYFFRPGADLYGRFTAGYLESMYAGVSGEVLWKPVNGPLALGVELNYAVQRDFDMRLGLQDYDIVTGHASAYYDFGNGYLGQVDAGRYLAGDWGATFSMDREFDNGFRMGAFFTLTDVSTDDFGEGSFDKGIRFTIPLSRISGEPSRSGFGQTIRPVTRDGGARLNIRNRLYEVTRGYHDPELREDWGKFWR